MRILIKYIFAAALLMLISNLQSCSKLKMPLTPGEIVTEERTIPLEQINHLVIDNDVNVVISTSQPAGIKIKAGKNLLKNIKTIINDTILYLKDENYSNWERGYRDHIIIYLNLLQLKQITFNGSAIVSSSDTLRQEQKNSSLVILTGDATGIIDLKLKVQSLKINHYFGVADIILHGTANSCLINTAGRGRIDAADLSVSDMRINDKSPNDCYLNVTNNLKGYLRGYGNIYLKGTPAINMDLQGPGQIIQVD